jgi:hypothetical protein
MKTSTQPIRSRLMAVIMAGVTGAGFATAAAAAGAGVDANADARAKAATPGYVQAGGAADAHMNAYGSAHTNAQWKSGASRGTDRAAERASTGIDALEPSTTAEFEVAGKASAQARRPGSR